MTLAEIQTALKDNGINLKPAEVEAKLKAYEMTAHQVTPEVMIGWIEELKQGQAQPPARLRKGGELTKTETEAIAPQSAVQPPAPTPSDIPVDVPFTHLDQIISGVENVGVEIVVQTNHQINHVVEKVVSFVQSAPTLTAQRINQRMGLGGVENPVESILQVNRELCSNSLSRIDEAIARAS
ncbi:hypothetical protein NDA01_26545 [Trichocoleus desertorum AS-A10]|uniref:hypothetical protein n=1 Tax=Trichocoleus desertorum TaxID=1481672 RepID=UPI003299EF34